MAEFRTVFTRITAAVNHELENLLPNLPETEHDLFDAMRYAVLGGGKRLRPLIVVAGGEVFGVQMARSLRVAAAVEIVHAYSLIHDDLPCMDDDELRRGQPTVHIRFNEATAVLAGDALLTLAFEVLADKASCFDPEARMCLVAGLARAVGGQGMVGGQALDLWAEENPLDPATIINMQRLKTGELIAFSGEAGAILGSAEKQQRKALRMFALDLGLAFQITDDLLDIEGVADVLGKAVGKDAKAGKSTMVSSLGVEGARDYAIHLANKAARHLNDFGAEANTLRALCEFVITRRN